MFLKQAWNNTVVPSTGMVSFDCIQKVGIGNMESEQQVSVFVGNAHSTSFPRETIIENLIEGDLLPPEWGDCIYEEPDSEFNFHMFYYQTKSGVRPMYKCLVKIDGSGVSFIKEVNYVRSSLGFSKSKRVISSLKSTLSELHIECHKVETLAREVAKDKSLRSLVSNKVRGFGQDGYFGMKDMSGCLAIAQKSGWGLSNTLQSALTNI
ncbi:hypothetical protein [Vibrio crassostreae]|uniref:hypothetical protein n=1 Tax=Vibrio crassostreae TaxID=246167 RepID=UPI001B3021BF|nr:hypothetical protein [Vibrio crassostreae]